MIDALVLTALSPADEPGKILKRDEIVVKGERVERSRHETAASVEVLDAASLDEMAVPDRVEQLLAMIPNIQLGSGGEGPTIRGQDSTGVVRDLAAFLSGVRPRATISIDGRTATYYELAFGITSIWDVESVEVFRSPQTTTQGRNSIGGAIFVETRDPAFEWEGRARLVVGDYDTRQTSGVVSGPLIAGQLAMRISGDLRRSRTSNEITSAARDIVDPNRDENEMVRVKVLARPDALPGSSVKLTYSHGRLQMPQIEGIVPPYEDRTYLGATYGIFAMTVDSVTGEAEFSLASGLDFRATVGYGAAEVRRHAPEGLGEARISTRDYSFEPLIAWGTDSGLRISGGMHYTRALLDQEIDISALQQGTGKFDDAQSSLGIFGELVTPLAPEIELTAGLRYQQDRQVRRGGLAGGRFATSLDYDGRFKAILPKFSVAWDITPNFRIGALAQRATNPGGVNLNNARARVETFGAERLWAFELFARSRLANDRLTLSINAFDYRMEDAQRTQTITFMTPTGQVVTTAQIDNAPRARANGLELDVEGRISRRLRIRVAAGLLDTRILQTLEPADPMLDKRFQRAPNFTGNASVVWRPSDDLSFSAQARHHSAYYSDDFETAARRIESGSIIDARISWSSRGLMAFGYVRNLFDKFNLSYKFGNGLATADDPREVGVGIDARF